MQGFVSEAAFIIATDRYEPTQDRLDPSRMRAKEFITDELGISKRAAEYACEQVDLVTVLSVDKTGMPDVQQLNAIVWASVGRAGWAQVNAWVMRKGGFGKLSAEALRHYCQRIKDDAKAEAEALAQARLPAGDPHDPAEVEVVDAEPVGGGGEPTAEPVVERESLQSTPPTEGPRWADAMELDAAFDIPRLVYGLARGTPDMIAARCDGMELLELRGMLAAAMAQFDRPPDRVAHCLSTPSREAVIKALQGMAALMRERVGVA
jgi:hypothetical protein